ncbi:MAG: HlyC/CorC family transporter [Myxococcaceae bacterium]|nr:MAG: HlyC/CorC family transporter [Myxococcaceae bacterium]
MSGGNPEVAAVLGASLFLAVGAVLVTIESSLVSLPDARMRALRDELGSKGKRLETYLADPMRVLSRLLAGRVICPILATALIVAVAMQDQPPWWEIVLRVLAVATVYGLLTEVAVAIGRHRARQIAPEALGWVRPIGWLLAPFAFPMALVGKTMRRWLAERSQEHVGEMTEKEVEYVVEAAEQSGAVDAVSSEMLQNVIDLKEMTAREIMVPRTQVVALDIHTPFDKAVARMSEEGHSRVPLFEGQIDNVVGVLVTKDLFRVATQPEGKGSERSLEALARKPVIMVSDTQPVTSVLRELQLKRMHLAMVVDEFGAILGLVTLEDILEELVGDIRDEHDEQADTDVVEIAPGRYLVSAAMAVSDLSERLSVRFPEDGDYTTLGGFLSARAGKVPSVGTVVLWDSLRFVVREGDKRRATKVEVVRDPQRANQKSSAADDDD